MSLLKILLGIESRLHPRLLPNMVPYTFIARLHDGTIVPCENYKTEFGIRMGIRTQDQKIKIEFEQIKDWIES